MKRKITELYVRGQMKLMGWKERFFQDETGDQHMIEMIVSIVILIVVTAIFQRELQKVITDIFGKLSDVFDGGLYEKLYHAYPFWEEGIALVKNEYRYFIYLYAIA